MTDHSTQHTDGFQPAGKRQRFTSDDDDTEADDEASGWNSTLSSEAGGSSPFSDVFENEDDDIEIFSAATISSSADGDALPHPSYDLTESMIAQRMSSLSMKEREEVYFDIHGVNSPIDEDAERGFRERKLQEMADELAGIQLDDRKAFDMAHSMNPSYVEDFDFRLRFLRAERFDAKLAAVRYARHYQVKLELFGPDKLGKNITQADLDSEDLEALYCGMAQILPRRDTAGRLVWLWIPNSTQQSFSDKSLLRRIFYNTMMVSEDLETQQRGSIFIGYALNFKQKRRGVQSSIFFRNLAKATQSLPIMLLSLHCCYDNYTWMPVLSLLKFSSHLFLQLRFQTHFGSHRECMYKLQTFGIPVDTIPIDENGQVSTDCHRRFLEKRRLLEEQAAALAAEQEKSKNKANSTTADDNNNNSKPEPKILIPASRDVLLGRGSGYFNHVGNVRYRGLIEDRKVLYDTSNKKQKQKMAEEILTIVHGYGGRFLRGDDGCWVPVDNKSKLKKIAHSFRALRPSSSQNNNSKNPTTGAAQAQNTVPPISKRMSRS